jgi:phosphoribosylformylglycinamidine cyclo-ligase
MDGKKIKAGDELVAIASSGLHSNGFSLVRKLIRPEEKELLQTALTPTRIYVKPLLALHRAGLLKAAAHITGGGLTENLPRVLPENTVATVDPNWDLPPVFAWLARTGNVAAAECLRVWNCGIGMALVVAAEHAEAATALLQAHHETVHRLGVIEAGEGEARVRYTAAPRWA